ncbi:IclR family transcriptional regulator [Actinomadura sp. NAK00032]|uniref:IclR family transcriptional regulator n=1 Tax=Actinomadura sp. NAK00032 TaxID=2742128 RepID=UPI0015920C88|nr:IclR family transcriptional regulator [Actinomadura sp. NAK00032]QKW35649.1 IclR family transcriptional regulator [Actinomadura sp. NAK00032]
MGDNDKGPNTARGEGVRSVARAVELLQLFDVHHRTRTLRDLVELTGLPKTTVIRLLATLESLGLVSVTGEMTYGLGAGFLRWVRLSQLIWEVSTETRAIMRELVDRCGETVNIYARQDAGRVCIAQEEGTATVRSVVEVGVPMTLAAGASATILLADAPAHLFDELEARGELLDPVALKRQVAAVRETGYAVTHGERELGASSVAAPIRAKDGRIVAALAASGPTSRFTAEQISEYVPAVTRAAARITEVGLGNVEAFL